MASKDNFEDSERQILEVLEHLQQKYSDRHGFSPNLLTEYDIKTPSSAADSMGSDFRGKTKEKVCAVRDSFDIRNIESGEGPSRKSSSHPLKQAQERGQLFHQTLAEQIKAGNGAKGQFLTEIEKEFHCRFLLAEVKIYGFAVRKSKVDFYRGKIDALAFHQSPGGDPEVYVVDWKTSAKDDLPELEKWWNEATIFKKPLYQCLLYRELLQTHFKTNNITTSVGIMLVPFHQARPEQVMPGLCMDFQKMDEVGLLDDFKKYRWFTEESGCVHTVTLPCNLFNQKRLENGILPEGTLVKDIIAKSATVRDLCQELGLLKLKLERSSTADDSSSDPERTRDENDSESKATKKRISWNPFSRRSKTK